MCRTFGQDRRQRLPVRRLSGLGRASLQNIMRRLGIKAESYRGA